jgi:hypothetical protein
MKMKSHGFAMRLLDYIDYARKTTAPKDAPAPKEDVAEKPSPKLR